MAFADIAAVHAIENATVIGAWSEKLFSDCIKVGYDCWVMIIDNQIAGYGILNYAANEAHILNLVIAPAYQRQGNGKKLLQHLLNTAKVQNSEEVYLEVRVSNTPAINLYKQFDFIEIGMRKNYYPADATGRPAEDAITMTLSLW
jgi:ribosomal-protein-alanine N-acetyltransferase